MAPRDQPQGTKRADGPARRKLNTKSTTSNTTPGRPRSQSRVSSRRAWRSSAPRAQHAWQASAKGAANTADGTEVQRIYSLLSQIYRRNKNQHRAGKWWKCFSILRRQVGVFVQAESELRVTEGGGGGEDEKAEDVRRRLERRKKLEAQKMHGEAWVRDVLIPRCYLAFSTVVQDGQFASLGVVLLGVLASVGTRVGLPRAAAERITAVSLRQTGVDRGEVIRREYSSPKPGLREESDVGERAERSTLVEKNESAVEAVDTKETTAVDVEGIHISSSTAKRKDKKKKGKRSAIDDLFAGLL